MFVVPPLPSQLSRSGTSKAVSLLKLTLGLEGGERAKHEWKSKLYFSSKRDPDQSLYEWPQSRGQTLRRLRTGLGVFTGGGDQSLHPACSKGGSVYHVSDMEVCRWASEQDFRACWVQPWPLVLAVMWMKLVHASVLSAVTWG